MIGAYLKERRSWIAFFIFTQLLILFIAFVDSSVPFKSLAYMVFLDLLLFVLFLLFRYRRETDYFRQLGQDQVDRTAARSPFEQLADEALHESEEQYKRELTAVHTEMEQEKDEIVNWIHEVKTPLTAMQLMIERTEDETLKSRLTYEWLRIHLLLDQQLHQKRLPFLQNDLYIEQVDLHQLLTQEIKQLKTWCMQKGIGFELDLAYTEVLTDGKWLAFIVRQLLTNAVKYSEESDIEVSGVSVEGRKQLVLRDFGAGIEARDLPRIFEKGFTKTSGHQDRSATGMGLYLAKKVADTLKIRLDIQSTAGQGTVCTLHFPDRNELNRMTGM